ncbi:MAG: Uma2 family endonuclease [Phormidesmis sp.]
MTYTPLRYRSYQEYLDDDQLGPDGNYRLLSTGEVIEVSSEDDDNLRIAMGLAFILLQMPELKGLVRTGNKEFQVDPVGDQRVNRKPDVIVMQREHLTTARQAITFGQLPPQFVAEVVSPGPESSENYKRDCLWKRSQYQQWRIPEYWIIDPHRQQVMVLTLQDDIYRETTYKEDEVIVSQVFPELSLTASAVLTG